LQQAQAAVNAAGAKQAEHEARRRQLAAAGQDTVLCSRRQPPPLARALPLS
jgi:hypothetical protein